MPLPFPSSEVCLPQPYTTQERLQILRSFHDCYARIYPTLRDYVLGRFQKNDNSKCRQKTIAYLLFILPICEEINARIERFLGEAEQDPSKLDDLPTFINSCQRSLHYAFVLSMIHCPKLLSGFTTSTTEEHLSQLFQALNMNFKGVKSSYKKYTDAYSRLLSPYIYFCEGEPIGRLNAYRSRYITLHSSEAATTHTLEAICSHPEKLAELCQAIVNPTAIAGITVETSLHAHRFSIFDAIRNQLDAIYEQRPEAISRTGFNLLLCENPCVLGFWRIVRPSDRHPQPSAIATTLPTWWAASRVDSKRYFISRFKAGGTEAGCLMIDLGEDGTNPIVKLEHYFAELIASIMAELHQLEEVNAESADIPLLSDVGGMLIEMRAILSAARPIDPFQQTEEAEGAIGRVCQMLSDYQAVGYKDLIEAREKGGIARPNFAKLKHHNATCLLLHILGEQRTSFVTYLTKPFRSTSGFRPSEQVKIKYGASGMPRQLITRESPQKLNYLAVLEAFMCAFWGHLHQWVEVPPLELISMQTTVEKSFLGLASVWKNSVPLGSTFPKGEENFGICVDEDGQSMVLPQLGVFLAIIAITGDWDGLGPEGDNLRMIIDRLAKITIARIDFGHALGDNDLVTLLTSACEVADQRGFRNLSCLMDTSLPSRMLGFHIMFRMCGIQGYEQQMREHPMQCPYFERQLQNIQPRFLWHLADNFKQNLQRTRHLIGQEQVDALIARVDEIVEQIYQNAMQAYTRLRERMNYTAKDCIAVHGLECVASGYSMESERTYPIKDVRQKVKLNYPRRCNPRHICSVINYQDHIDIVITVRGRASVEAIWDRLKAHMQKFQLDPIPGRVVREGPSEQLRWTLTPEKYELVRYLFNYDSLVNAIDAEPGSLPVPAALVQPQRLFRSQSEASPPPQQNQQTASPPQPGHKPGGTGSQE